MRASDMLEGHDAPADDGFAQGGRSDVDVAIVGYGPVGQLLALLLGRAGVSVCAVERHHSHFGLPRAVHFDDEVARILQSGGLIEDVQRIAHPSGRMPFEYIGAGGKTVFSFMVGGERGDAGWSVANSFVQPELEAALDRAVRALPNASVWMGAECIGIAEEADQVTLTVQARDGTATRQLSARYAIGADGANSFVARQMDVAVEDLGFSYEWLVTNVIFTGADAPNVRMAQIVDPARPITIVPAGGGRQRFEFMLVPGETPEQMNRAETSWALLAQFGITPDNAVLERHAVYTFGARWAKSWRSGRLLLAGDAAHLMPPFRAQGMCSGMRDAATLAWRLPLVLSGAADDSLLDSYETERIAHVSGLVEQTVELGEMICIADPERAAQRDRMLAAAAAMPDFKPPTQPLRLGPGLLRDGDPSSGFLGFQGRVERSGETGLFDEIVGRGFSLVAVGADPARSLSAESRAFLEEIGAVVAEVSPDGPVRDIEEDYARWFAAEQVTAVLMRPDFYRFGSARTAEDIEPLVQALREKLALREVIGGHDRRPSELQSNSDFQERKSR